MGRHKTILRWVGWGLIGAGTIVMVWGGLRTPAFRASSEAPPASPAPSLTPTLTLTPTPEPLIPTATSTGIASRTPRPSATPTLALSLTPTGDASAPVTFTAASAVTLAPAGTATSTSSPVPTLTPTVLPSPTSTAVAPVEAADFRVPPSEYFRLGVSLPQWQGNPDVLRALKVGWVMDWGARSSNPYGADVTYAQTVRMGGRQLSRDPATLSAIAAGNPGSLWLIANEADVRWQDNVTSDVYARLYHEAYHAIKAGDPSAVVAAGGIAQPTPLRLKYLDLALTHYQATYGTPMPADAWHIHNYMLREERGSWGVDIPPGLTEDTGVLYSISDSGNLDAFKSQIVTFRRWMLDRGYGGQPLVISEFGIPMPADYGFTVDVVAGFLRESMRYFLTATDARLGDPNSGDRLVERWCWFTLEDQIYVTGNLVDSGANRWTELGYTWLEMARE